MDIKEKIEELVEKIQDMDDSELEKRLRNLWNN